MKQLVTRLGLGFLMASIACGGGGGGGGPTEPLPNPTISSVSPNQARPGDQVTITGSNLGGAQSSVTFAGVAAQVTSASTTSIVAIVPNLAAGPATVTVTSGSRSGSFSGFSVLSATPVVNTISPNPVRAGGTLIISGQNLRASVGLALSQTVLVLIDAVTVVPLSVTNTEIQIQVPVNITPGIHVLRVNVDGELSNSVSFQVEIFTVTGTYLAQGPIVLNTCGIGDPVGTINTFEIAMTDSRPTLTGRIGAIPLQGTLTSGGSFNISHVEGTITERLEGNMIATPQGDVGFSARSTTSSSVLACSIIWDIIGARFTTVPTSMIPSATNNVSNGSEDSLRREALRSMMTLKMQ